MRHHTFSAPSTSYKLAVLAKSTSFLKSDLIAYFVNPLVQLGLSIDDIIAFDLEYTASNKAPVKLIKEYLNKHLLKGVDSLHITTLLCCDPNYFKVLTGLRKTSGCIGYIYPCVIKDYEHINIVLSPNHSSLFHDPTNQINITHGINTAINNINGNHVNFGTNIIHNESYPSTNEDIETTLVELLEYPELTCDIETFSLAIDKAGIGTIAFAWDQHNGVAFACDYAPFTRNQSDKYHGYKSDHPKIRRLLKRFFEVYTGKLIYHGSTFDIKMLIYNLWMKDSLDQVGLLEGLAIMTRLFDDTKIITFLATNSTSGNSLGLKENAHEFAGNYAEEDIENIRLIPLPDLLRYNLVDCLSTWYVYNKNYPVMLAANQGYIHSAIMIPSTKVILQMELTGMPMAKESIRTASEALHKYASSFYANISQSSIIKRFEVMMRKEQKTKDLLTRKNKAKHPEKIKEKDIEAFKDNFNPNSNNQLQSLLYDRLGFPVTNKTKSGAPSTKGKVIQKMLNKLILDHDIKPEELE